MENGTHLSLCPYRSRDMGDRTHQGHHWSRDLVSGLSSHHMGNHIFEIEGQRIKEMNSFFFYPPTSKIHQDLETALWSRGNEVHHSDV